MHPELFNVPFLNTSVKTYGAFLCLGFLSAVWLAMRRAERVKANADTVLDVAFLSLVFGVGGARLFYVIHYWKPQFAGAPNRFLAAINITEGGLEFLGGFLGAVVATAIYAKWKKVSLRLYLDILAPSCMWGLAFGRLGCFFNGCCFGGVCVEPQTHQPSLTWAAQFPFASPAHWRQWEDREVTVPAELTVTSKGAVYPWLLPGTLLSMSVERRQRPGHEYELLRKRLQQAQAAQPDDAEIVELRSEMESALGRKQAHDAKLSVLRRAQRFPSRVMPTRPTSVTELEQLAGLYRSLPVHPTQMYSAIHAILLSGLLTAIFWVRRRHGVVIGALLMLYPIPRILLELIRADNPHDVAGLTISQFVSLSLLAAGAAYLFALYKWMPERSPLVDIEMSKPQKGGKSESQKT